jgi:hypothetical protein
MVMPEAIVDLLELIEIDEEHRQVVPGPARPGDFLGEPTIQVPAIWKTGEGVGERLGEEMILRAAEEVSKPTDDDDRHEGETSVRRWSPNQLLDDPPRAAEAAIEHPAQDQMAQDQDRARQRADGGADCLSRSSPEPCVKSGHDLETSTR